MSLDACTLWTQEWLESLEQLPNATPPLLIIDDETLESEDIPILQVSLFSDLLHGSESSFAGEEPDSGAPGCIGTYSRIGHFRHLRHNNTWIFWSEAAVNFNRSIILHFTGAEYQEEKDFVKRLLSAC